LAWLPICRMRYEFIAERTDMLSRCGQNDNFARRGSKSQVPSPKSQVQGPRGAGAGGGEGGALRGRLSLQISEWGVRSA
jgi:hypothetical protein